MMDDYDHAFFVWRMLGLPLPMMTPCMQISSVNSSAYSKWNEP